MCEHSHVSDCFSMLFVVCVRALPMSKHFLRRQKTKIEDGETCVDMGGEQICIVRHKCGERHTQISKYVDDLCWGYTLLMYPDGKW